MFDEKLFENVIKSLTDCDLEIFQSLKLEEKEQILKEWRIVSVARQKRHVVKGPTVKEEEMMTKEEEKFFEHAICGLITDEKKRVFLMNLAVAQKLAMIQGYRQLNSDPKNPKLYCSEETKSDIKAQRGFLSLNLPKRDPLNKSPNHSRNNSQKNSPRLDIDSNSGKNSSPVSGRNSPIGVVIVQIARLLQILVELNLLSQDEKV